MESSQTVKLVQKVQGSKYIHQQPLEKKIMISRDRPSMGKSTTKERPIKMPLQ